MESEIALIKSKLKPTTTKVPVGIKGSDLSEEESLKIYQTYFDSGAQNWYPIFLDLTFPSVFLDLPRETALSLLQQINLYKKKPDEYKFIAKESGLEALLQAINQALEKAKWKKAFVKLSTRSPKDSISILRRGKSSLEAKIQECEGNKDENKKVFANQDYNSKLCVISQCIQDSFFIENASQALEVLISSDRVLEDIEYAFANETQFPFEKCGLQIVLREWKHSIAIQREFRGFVWEGSLNAIGQYYHSLYFPELIKEEEEIKSTLNKYFFEKVKPVLDKSLFKCCIVDFAMIDKENVVLIEINPFDGKCLASLKGSTGLFDLDKPEDAKIIENGPFELRLRKKPINDKDLKMVLNVTWKDEFKEYL